MPLTKKSPIKSLGFTLPKEMRLTGRANIREVFKRGKKYSLKDASLFILPNGLELCRFLCTFKRGFGCATERNRVRRVAKEVYRQSQHSIKKGFDLVFLPLKSCDSFCEIEDKIISLLFMAKIKE